MYAAPGPLLVELTLESKHVTVCISGGNPEEWSLMVRSFMSLMGLPSDKYKDLVQIDKISSAFITLKYPRALVTADYRDEQIVEQIERGFSPALMRWRTVTDNANK